jgi:hypothetical protein
MSTSNQYLIQLSRERDHKDFKAWKSMTGDGVDSAETFTRDGYGLPRVPLGGPKTEDTVTCSRTFYPDTDAGLLGELQADAGHTYYIANKQKLDPDGHAIGAPDVKRCMLKSCKRADVDVGNDSPSVDDYTIELTPEG